mmetsp:Transcript_27456/g.76749  ORF Transcript_27456/g.76749 Transcript_27456/m.76749 type:complete len:275 (+) Transcript_27456:67-891(+)
MSLLSSFKLKSKAELLRDSPSIKDGVTAEQEAKWRYQMCHFMREVGMKLGMTQISIGYSNVLFTRFFSRHSMKNEGVDLYVLATACILLGGKLGETPKPIRDIIIMSWKMRYRKRKNVDTAVHQLQSNEEYFARVKEAVLVAERSLLYTLGFDFNIVLPYGRSVGAVESMGLEKEVAQEVCRVAWSFINEVLRTDIILQYHPYEIADAVVYTTLQMMKVVPPPGNEAWETLQRNWPRLEEIATVVLELFNQAGEAGNKAGGSAAGGGKGKGETG